MIAISQNEKELITQVIDDVTLTLREATDFLFLKEYGRVFCVFDQNDSGNISFGVEQMDGRKYFIKVAGVATMNGAVSKAESLTALKRVPDVYQELKHPQVIHYLHSGSYQQLFYLVFEWRAGDCLFDHWNFDYYETHPKVVPPSQKIKRLALSKKQQLANQIIEFMTFVESKGYVAVDFYDGSLLYDFEKEQLTICDIDLFQKKPFMNTMGVDYCGSKRFKSPEEYQMDTEIKATTNVFTLGAMLYHLFGDYSGETIHKMNQESRFIPLEQRETNLSKGQYDILLKAVANKPVNRYQTIADFQVAWQANTNE